YCSFFSCVLRLPPTSSLFPYTTLFRSLWILESLRILEASRTSLLDDLPSLSSLKPCIPKTTSPSAEYSKATCKLASLSIRERGRSEEHTSELQSRFDLVCRLLLEKKKR